MAGQEKDLGKHILVIFEDNSGTAGRREGILTEVTDFGIKLDDKDVIPDSRIIRYEVKK